MMTIINLRPIIKDNFMTQELQELIDNNEVSEVEIVEFLSTLKKLSKNEVLDSRNFKMVIDHFGLKKKKGWIKFGNGSKYKF